MTRSSYKHFELSSFAGKSSKNQVKFSGLFFYKPEKRLPDRFWGAHAELTKSV
jgi:hypothetical protein